MDQERFARLLQRHDRLALPSHAVSRRAQREADLADEAGEGGFAHQEVGGALVAADFLEGEGAGAVAAFLFDGCGVAG